MSRLKSLINELEDAGMMAVTSTWMTLERLTSNLWFRRMMSSLRRKCVKNSDFPVLAATCDAILSEKLTSNRNAKA
jgi:hypothetical protein